MAEKLLMYKTTRNDKYNNRDAISGTRIFNSVGITQKLMEIVFTPRFIVQSVF